MTLVIGLLTFVLVVNCLFLMLLVLIQLPKKEAGAGLAFGGGATDALFGAGSGNALTKVTKYIATTFLGLALVLAVLNSRVHDTSRGIDEQLSRTGTAAATPAATPPEAAAGEQQQQLTTEPLTTRPTTEAQPGQPQPLPLTITAPTNAPAAGSFEPLRLETTPAPANTQPAPAQNPAPAPEQ